MTSHTNPLAGPPEDDRGPALPPLTRSRDRRVLGGVCDGAGRYFDIDPVVFRVVLSVLALTGGVGLIVYGFAWLIIPQEGVEQSEIHRLLSGRVEGVALTAVLIALVGCGLFLSMLDNSANQWFSLVLIAALAGAVHWSHRGRPDHGAADPVRPAPPAPPAAQPPPTPSTSSWWKEPLTKEAGGSKEPGTGYLWGPDYEPADARQPHPGRPRGERPGRERPWLGFFVILLAAAAAVAATALTWRDHPLGTSLGVGFTAALAVFGLGFVVGGFYGRLRGGTVVAATLTLGLLLASTTLPKTVGTGTGQERWAPTSASQLRSQYELGAGEAELDLTGLEPAGRTVVTRVDMGAGRLDVRVPDDATVKITAQVGLGDVLFSERAANREIDLVAGKNYKKTFEPEDGVKSTGTIELNLRVGLGMVTVIR